MFENTNANFPMPVNGMGVNNLPPWGFRAPMQVGQPMVSQPMQSISQNGIPNTLQPGQPKGIVLTALPVTSIDEAKAAMVTDGNMYVFVNVSQGEIYTKQFNLVTGTSDFYTYKLYKPTEVAQSNFVTLEDLKKYDDTLDKLSKEIEGLKGGMANAKFGTNSSSFSNGNTAKK